MSRNFITNHSVGSRLYQIKHLFGIFRVGKTFRYFVAQEKYYILYIYYIYIILIYIIYTLYILSYINYIYIYIYIYILYYYIIQIKS